MLTPPQQIPHQLTVQTQILLALMNRLGRQRTRPPLKIQPPPDTPDITKIQTETDTEQQGNILY